MDLSLDALRSILSNVVYYRGNDSVMESLNSFIYNIFYLRFKPDVLNNFLPIVLEAKCKLDPWIYIEGGADFFHTNINLFSSMIGDLRSKKSPDASYDDTSENLFGMIHGMTKLIQLAGEYGDINVYQLLDEAQTWRPGLTEASLATIVGPSIFRDAMDKILVRENSDIFNENNEGIS